MKSEARIFTKFPGIRDIKNGSQGSKIGALIIEALTADFQSMVHTLHEEEE